MIRVVRSANAALAISLTSGSIASAQSLLQFDFNELRGVFTSKRPESGGTFNASAASEPGFLTAGSGARSAWPPGEALFDTGFVAEPNPADVVITMTVGPIRSGRASADGTVVLTDVDGDTIALCIAGTISFANDGEVLCATAVTDVDVNSDEGLFDGTDGGSISLADMAGARGDVNITFPLRLTRPGTGPVVVQVASTGSLSGLRAVPAPSSAALLAIAAITVGVRRRSGRWA
jgi:hypothetical protein